MVLNAEGMKELKHSAVKLLVVHCVACKTSRPFSVENLIACGKAKYGQCSYHYYVRLNGEIVPLLPESVQGFMPDTTTTVRWESSMRVAWMRRGVLPIPGQRLRRRRCGRS